MASTYTSNSGVEKPGIGDQSGEWGTTVNTNMDILDRAINGVGVITLSGTTHTLTTTDGALSDGQYKVLVLSGSPSGTNTITISPNDQDKLYFVVNSSGQTATFSQGSGANVSVVNGDTKIIYADGAGSGAAITEFASEVDALEGITAGTVAASKAVIVDANKDITGFRNVTLAGDMAVSGSGNRAITITSSDGIGSMEIGSAASAAAFIDLKTPSGDDFDLRLSSEGGGAGGNITIAGGTFSLNGSAETMATFADDGAASLYYNNAIKIATASGGITVTGEVAATSLDISGDADIDGTLEADAITLNGTALGSLYSPIAGSSSIVTTGALNSGSITSGFGTINNGSSAITTTGTITGGTVDSPLVSVRNPSAGQLYLRNLSNINRIDSYNDPISATYPLQVNASQMTFLIGDAEKMRLDTNGRLGIGTTAPENPLTIQDIGGSTFNRDFAIRNGDATNYHRLVLGYNAASAASGVPTNAQFVLAEKGGGYGTNAGLVVGNSDNAPVMFTSNATERMRIANDGKVGVGTSGNLTGYVNLPESDYGEGFNWFSSGTAANRGGIGHYAYESRIYYGASDNLTFVDGGPSGTERMRIAADGNVAIGESSTTAKLDVHKASTCSAELATATNGHLFVAQSDDNTDAFEIYQKHGSNTTRMSFVVNDNRTGSKSAAFSVRGDGAVAVAGALSKGSGSFKIDHPLESKKDTHYLAHSFVEGPQADNIYRGKVNLVNGTATVNVDTVANLTEGTFVALNRDIQCFTTNETGWTAVKGSVLGNVLTINAQDNTCTDTVSWLVIGERQDPHMYEVDWTDENGKVITEPLKEES